MTKPIVECTGLYVEVAVFTEPYRFRGFIKRDLFLVQTYGPDRRDGQPFREAEYKAIELEEGSGVYWPVRRNQDLQYPGCHPNKCDNWGVWSVQVGFGHDLPKDLGGNSEIQLTG